MAMLSLTVPSSFLPRFPQNQPHPSSRQNPLPPRRNPRCSISVASPGSPAKSFEIPWGCENESLEGASELQRWLSDSGLPPQRMAIERVDVGERGLVALKNVRKGEKLLFVPPSLVITADSVRFWNDYDNLVSFLIFFVNKFTTRGGKSDTNCL